MKDKKNKILVSVLSIVGLLLVIGVSYAYFGYFERGTKEIVFEGGKLDVLFTSVTGDNVTLEGMYPMTDEDGLLNGITYDFNITGYNESKKDIHYRLYMEDNASIEGKSRFYDDDIRIAVYKNGEEVLKPSTIEDFYDPGYYFDVIPKGTSVDNPVSHNYTVKVWIGDHVRITDAVCEEGYTCYSQDDYKNLFFGKIMKVEADFSYDDLGYLTYNTMGGLYQPEKTSVSTQTVTAQKPYKEGKGFLGWSSDSNSDEVEYYAGDTYTGVGKTLYAVYSDTKNVMDVFSETILEYAGSGEGGYDDPGPASNDLESFGASQLTTNGADYSVYSGITKIYFINDTRENIDERYNAAEIKDDLTLDNQGSVKAWLEDGENTYLEKEYTLYVGAEGTIYFSNCESMFENFGFLYYLDLTNVDSIDVTSMYRMFANSGYYDSGFEGGTGDVSNSIYDIYKTIPLGGYVTSPTELEIRNLESLNTSNVTDMSGMFYECNAFNLDVSKFNTAKVTNMSGIFRNTNAIELDVSNFNTAKVSDMSYMFAWSDNLQELDLSSFDTSNVTDMSYMLCNSGLSELNIENFNTAKVTDMSHMFANLGASSLDVSSFNTSNVTDMEGMFNWSSLISLDLSSFDTSNVANMYGMFRYSLNLTYLDLASFDTSKVTSMYEMFKSCRALKMLKLNNFNTFKVTTMKSMFGGCSNLTQLDVSSFDTSNVTDMEGMFSGCSSLTKLDLSNFNFERVSHGGAYSGFTSIFSGCSSLVELDISSVNQNKMSTSYIFRSMPDNAKIYVGSEEVVDAILSSSYNNRPSAWTVDNFVIKG